MLSVSHLGDNNQKKEFQLNEAGILFDLLEKQQEILPHGCLAGACGACLIEIISGDEFFEEPDLIESKTLGLFPQNNLRLSCRARVKKIDGRITIKSIDKNQFFRSRVKT